MRRAFLALLAGVLAGCTASSQGTDATTLDVGWPAMDGPPAPDATGGMCDGGDLGDLDATECPNDLPLDCPDGGGPSFDGSVFAIIMARCTRCHAPAGISSDKPLTSWPEIYRVRGTVLTQVAQCRMPPDGGSPCLQTWPSLTPEERRTVATWVICGAHAN